MQKATFILPQMDCSSEETLIKMKLSKNPTINQLVFDIPNRKLEVYFMSDLRSIEEQLESLNLGSKWVETVELSEIPIPQVSQERRLLWIVLGINFGFFIIESLAGYIAKSMGLIADSLDMLADAIVYGLALMAVGKAIKTKQHVAKVAGIFQIFLAVVGFAEVIRRFSGMESPPDFLWMILVSLGALVANGYCLFLLQKSKSQEAHMQASMIFTSNDIIINLGVIVAGLAVLATKSAIPDLIIGGIVYLLVMQGAIRILKL